MKAITKEFLFQMVCKAEKKWGMAFQFDDPDKGYCHFQHTAPWFTEENLGEIQNQMFSDNEGFLLFDTEKEMDEIFNQTIMDEAKNDETPVYALTCDSDGNLLSENT